MGSNYPCLRVGVALFVFTAILCPFGVLGKSQKLMKRESATKIIQVEVRTLRLSEDISSCDSCLDSKSQRNIRAGLTSVVNPVQSNRLLIGFLFGLWYFLNVAYNISNKIVLNKFPLSITVAWLQLGVGSFYAIAGWLSGLRGQAVWTLANSEKKLIAPVAVFHGLAQLATVISLGAGMIHSLIEHC